VAVEATELRVKQILARFSKLTGLPVLPLLKHQIDANKLRAYYVREYCQKTGSKFDWHAQAISSGYGPLGFYHGAKEITSRDLSDQLFTFPKFLGIQQEAICPFVKRLGIISDITNLSEEILEPSLFRSQPTNDLYEGMESVLKTYGGKIRVLHNQDYFHYSAQAVSILAKAGIIISPALHDKKRKFVETAGLITLAGTLHEIDEGHIKAGENVLVVVTGGAQPSPKTIFNAKYTLDETPTDEKLMEIYEMMKRSSKL